MPSSNRVSGGGERDLVIVGSGIGALTAALTAATDGLSVTVLEKTDRIGGNSALSGGVLWIPANPLMARDGCPDTLEQARTYLDILIGDVGIASSPQRRSAFLSGGPELVAFLERSGIPLQRQPGRPDYYDELPGGSQAGRCLETRLFDLSTLGDSRGQLRLGSRVLPIDGRDVRHIFLGRRTLGGVLAVLRLGRRIASDRLLGRTRVGVGAAMVGHLFKACLDAGVEFRLRYPVTGLAMHEGRVTGVTGAGEASCGEVCRARAVLIAAGGFARNKRMLDTYRSGAEAVAWTSAGPGETGEMIEAAMALGADVALMDQAIGILTSILPDGSPVPHVYDLAKPHAIVVDRSGHRYLDECASYMENAQRMLARDTLVPALPSWLIMDGRHRRFYPWANARAGATPPEWISSGYLKVADTLADLAQLCAIEPGTLESTVARFNGFAARGVDEDYHRGQRAYDRYFGDPRVKPNPSLGSIAQAPFMAVALYPGDVGTFGGLVTDACARVLRADGSVIHGLYAAGTCTASVMGKVYPGAGASLAAAAIFGRIAAQHCARSQTHGTRP